MDRPQPSDSMSSPPRKKRRDKTAQVAVPSVQNPPSGFSTSANRVRSDNAWIQKGLQMREKKLTLFLKQATIIEVPYTLDDLKKPQDKDELQRICTDVLGPNQPSQCMSARFVDPAGKPLLAYFGYRIKKHESFKGNKIPLSDQYNGRTKETLELLKRSQPDGIISDGLTPEQCEAYQLAAQSLCSALPLHFDSTRHEGTNIMKFQSESGGNSAEFNLEPDNDEVNPEAYELDDDGSEKKEKAGTLHCVHAWPQQGQAKLKGLFISGDISHTSTSLQVAGSYYYLTKSIAATIGEMFLAVFPEEYQKYEKAFKAGVWMQCDPGPYLGRAIIYKLQGRLHKDRHDIGPSASFGVGQYTGGEMLFPQFPSKFSYDPGHVCIFYSSIIYHKVAKFDPAVQTMVQAEADVTPGRIGTVFFFPEESYKILCDKKPGWGYQTAFGRNEGLVPKRFWDGSDDEDKYESEEKM